MRILIAACVLAVSPSFASAQITAPVSAMSAADPVAAINATLDAFNHAASVADGPRYFGLLAKDAVFIGTDASERWTVPEFRAYAEPYFAKGHGWTYIPRTRHVVIADIPCKCVATFDETLDNASYGTTRGTGTLVLEGGSWKIEQYALTIPIPNDLARTIVPQIQAFEKTKTP